MAFDPVFANHVQLQDKESEFDVYSEFLEAVRNKTKQEVVECLQKNNQCSSDTEVRVSENDKDKTSNPALAESPPYRKKLLKALQEKDAGEVWNLIAEAKDDDLKTLENLNEVCKSVADQDRLKEAGLMKYLWETLKRHLRCSGWCRNCISCRENEQRTTEFQNEEEQQWIRILCDPLYISLKWLWRSNPKSELMNSSAKGKANDSKQQDVIEAALRDAHLLEKIASYEHHYSKDEYTRLAEEYDKFATHVVNGSNLKQLHQVMDLEGTGCLLLERPENFNQSLGLLKIAADKERKGVCVLIYFLPFYDNNKVLLGIARSVASYCLEEGKLLNEFSEGIFHFSVLLPTQIVFRAPEISRKMTSTYSRQVELL